MRKFIAIALLIAVLLGLGGAQVIGGGTSTGSSTGGTGSGHTSTSVEDGGIIVTATNYVGNYVSGTNARAMAGGAAGARGGTVPYWDEYHCQSLKLMLDGEVVLQWIRDPTRPDAIPDDQLVMFDSTHFANGHALSVQSEVTYLLVKHTPSASKTVVVTNTDTVPVKNSALLAQYSDPLLIPTPISAVSSLIGSNFGNVVREGSWSPMSFVDGMTGCNVIFYSGHGTPDCFFAGNKWIDGAGTGHDTYLFPFGDDQYVPGHPDWLQSVGIEPYRIPQMGTGLPPFNSTSNPPVYLALLVNCGTGDCQDFIRFCLPYADAYGHWLEDQAWTGFLPALYLKDEYGIATVLFTSLSQGYTLRQARSDLMGHTPKFWTCPEDGEPPTRPLVEGDMAIYGDLNMKLTTVYTGTNSPPSGWYGPSLP